VEENITNAAVNKLLAILKPIIPSLPLDARTLKGTPRNVEKSNIAEGQYVHYGIKDSLTDFFLRNNYNSEVLQLNFNVDGLPVVKSSGVQLWPVLMNISNTDAVLLVGVFEGRHKPTDISRCF